jgi:hypothetical protein
MFELKRIEDLSRTHEVDILAKVIFSFTPDILLSPLALPRKLLNNWIDDILGTIDSVPLTDLLLQLKTRPNFEEQWPDEYVAGIKKGKARVLQIEKIRNDTYTLADILSTRKEVYDWYKSI